MSQKTTTKVSELKKSYSELSETERHSFLNWIEQEHIKEMKKNVENKVQGITDAINDFGNMCEQWSKKHIFNKNKTDK